MVLFDFGVAFEAAFLATSGSRKLESHWPFVSAPHRPQQMVLLGAFEAARIGMHEEVQVTPVGHHPRDDIRISIHGYEDCKIRGDEWGSVDFPARSRSVHGKGAELPWIPKGIVVIALGDVEMLDEGPRTLR